MNELWRIIKLLRPYKVFFFLAFLCMMGFALTNGAMAWLIGPVMKFLFSSETEMAVNIIPFDLFTIPKERMTLAVPIIIIAVALTKGVSQFGQSYFMGYVGRCVIRDIRKKLYDHILTLPVDYFSKNPTGTLISRLTNDVNLLSSTTSDAIATVLKQSLTLVVLAVVIISLDWKLALVSSVAMPLAVYPMRKLGRKMKKASTKGQVSMGTMTSLLHEAIAGVRIVKAFGMEGYESERFGAENNSYTRYLLKQVKVQSISSPLMESLGAVAFAVTIWYASYRIGNGTLKPESFISFFAAVIMFYQPLKALNGVNLNIQNGLAAGTRIFDLLEEPGEVSEGDTVIDGLGDSIEFRDVSFRYGATDVLEGINLTVRKGEVLAIVGSSGSGKTTFVNLIPRFYDVSGGAVLFDGRDIRDMTLDSLRAQIAIVSQQIILFNDTVRNNIAYGSGDVSDGEVVEAALAANAHGFITALAEGYDTIIGEGGVRLSGGERQRLSIARAILKNAPVLILDEATSSLDTESEVEVHKGLANLMEGKTTFVIAHRLSTVRGADRIIVLADGSIKEIGRHDELVSQGGEYARLYSIQFK